MFAYNFVILRNIGIEGNRLNYRRVYCFLYSGLSVLGGSKFSYQLYFMGEGNGPQKEVRRITTHRW